MAPFSTNDGIDDNALSWHIVSDFIGWSYFTAWSISFYPQVFLNWQRKSVQGLSFDFLYYNVVGFFCYSVFNLSFFFSSEIQQEYKDRNDGNENLVRANDVGFAVHALAISLFTLGQTFIYKKEDTQRISSFASSIIWAIFLGAIAILIAVHFDYAMWIDLMYYLSYVKLLISFIKYIPQAWLNYRRKSTVGWSIHNILLDFTGGFLSIVQLLLDAYLSDDWSGVSGDPVKFGLGFVAIAFDLLFITQHYVLYRDRTDFYVNTLDEERRRLIVEGRVPREDDEVFHHSRESHLD